MRLEQAPPAVSVIRLYGVFDGPAARRLEAMLVHADVSSRFHVDLSQIREFHDFAIAVLGQALTRTRASVSLRGLRTHQIQVLRYFGVDTAPLESAVATGAA